MPPKARRGRRSAPAELERAEKRPCIDTVTGQECGGNAPPPAASRTLGEGTPEVSASAEASKECGGNAPPLVDKLNLNNGDQQGS